MQLNLCIFFMFNQCTQRNCVDGTATLTSVKTLEYLKKRKENLLNYTVKYLNKEVYTKKVLCSKRSPCATSEVVREKPNPRANI